MPRCLLCGENLGLGSFVARAMGLEMTCTQGLPRTGLILGSWCEDPAPSCHVLLGAASSRGPLLGAGPMDEALCGPGREDSNLGANTPISLLQQEQTVTLYMSNGNSGSRVMERVCPSRNARVNAPFQSQACD